jgi:hypothetical protein
MGRTRFSGPVYGAKQTLFSVGWPTLSTGTSTVAAATIVPAGEDWYATEFQAYRGSTASSQGAFWVTDDSSVVSSITFTSTTVGANSINVITADGGEKEGTKIASGSTVRFHYSDASSQAAMTQCSWALFGYRRFVTRSRAD